LILFAPAALAANDTPRTANATVTLEARKDLSRRALGMWAGGASVDTSIFAPDYRNHQEPAADGGVKTIDLADWIAVVEANHRAFPDLQVTFLTQVAEDDRVATHWRFTATQQGRYEGLAPTGRRVSWTGVQIDRFRDGEIAESWVVWDKYTQFEMLGIID
jgi:predicted ester cyclase